MPILTRLDTIDDVRTELCRRLARSFCDMLKPQAREKIVPWIQRNVDLSYDATSAAHGKVHLYPYQIEPLEATEDPTCREVTLCWGQRLGKSTIWKFSMLKRVHDGGLSGLIVYPNMKLAEDTNRDTVQPLLETLPEVKRDLAIQGGKKKDGYHIPSCNSVVYFQGGGAQVVSRTCNWTVLDETDFISLAKAEDEDENMSQLRAVRLRMQTFKERMMIVCSSPTSYSGTIWDNWQKGSQGEWSLRCLECGRLYPTRQLAFLTESGKYAGLQWEKDMQGNVIEDSIRWICPKCGHEHTYADAQAMNEQGQYVFANPSRREHRSYRCGALGNPWVWTWKEIAEKQEEATDADGKKFLCNVVMGMPYKHVREGDASVSIEDAMRAKSGELPADLGERLKIVCMGIDQQKSEMAGMKYYVYVVRGWDDDGNSWLLKHGTANDLNVIDAVLDEDFCGHKVGFCLIDQGGFNNDDDLDPFVRGHRTAFYYKGADKRELDNADWMQSKNQAKLFIVNALRYQVKLLSLIYDPVRASGYHWNLPTEVSKEYFRQMVSVRPNAHMTKDGNGEAYQNWCCFGDARRDFFDAEKMALAAMEIGTFLIPSEHFVGGSKPKFRVREWLRAAARKQNIK